MNPGSSALPDRIQWHEGMLLSPQHFQQFQARIDALGAWQQLAAQPLAWGVRRCEIDHGLLNVGLLRVLALEVVLPDGTPVWHNAHDPLDGSLELDLSIYTGALEAGPLDIYLTLPWSRTMRNPDVPTRFRSLNHPPIEDEVSDSLAVDLPRLRPKLGLSAGATPTSLWQSLRIATLVRADGLTRLSDALPPLMQLSNEHPLWRRAWDLCANLRGKAAYLARQSQMTSSQIDDRVALLEHKARLGALLTPLTQLEAVLQTQPLHPYALYLTLCSALGPLATLRPGAMPPLSPAYIHNAQTAVFDMLLDNVAEMLSHVSQEHRLHPFELRDGIFSIPMQAEWRGSRLVVGLRGQPERDLLAWMAGAVIGSASAWASLRDRRVLGAGRAPIEAAPELGLRGGAGYTLFEIDPQDAKVSAGDPLQIFNANETHEAQRPHEVVLFVKG